ncbi:MAG: MFS transporter [Bacillota bacterium]
MTLLLPRSQALAALTADGWLLMLTRAIRLFAYGCVSVILVLYLVHIGLSDQRIGLLLTLTLVGDTAISLWLTTRADRLGRRRMLIIGAGLMVFAGIVFVLTRSFLLLLLATTLGVISPSGNEVGPFLSIEQASLAQVVPDQRRTGVFAWYSLAGSFATALGSLTGGVLTQELQWMLAAPLAGYRIVLAIYAVLGLVSALLFMRLSPRVEVYTAADGVPTPASSRWGLGRSRGMVLRLSGLFALDAFGGGFVIQSLAAYWFHLRFGTNPAALGGIFFAANLFAGFSALAAAWVASRIGLLNTMVFTHLPSNVLLILVPLMPTPGLAILVLLLRFSISQMDVPTRQSYTMAVVSPAERSAAAGVTGVARTTGAAISPLFAGLLLGNVALLNVTFFLAGGLKIAYDVLLYRSFRMHRPREESLPATETSAGLG